MAQLHDVLRRDTDMQRHERKTPQILRAVHVKFESRMPKVEIGRLNVRISKRRACLPPLPL
jgi:hypothetical protein